MDEKDKEESFVVSRVFEAKAEPEGVITGYLCQFGSPSEADTDGDYFTPNTDFGRATKSEVWFNHGWDKEVGKKRFTTELADLERDERGVKVAMRVDLSTDIGRKVYKATELGRLGLSSGVPAHLVQRRHNSDGTHEIEVWPLGADASLTRNPADRRNRAEAKAAFSLDELLAESGEPSPEAKAESAETTAADAGMQHSVSDTAVEAKSTEATHMAEAPAIIDSARLELQMKETVEMARAAQAEAKSTKDKLDEILELAKSKGFMRGAAPEEDTPEAKAAKEKAEEAKAWRKFWNPDDTRNRSAKATLMAGDDQGGGYTRVPPEFRAQLLEELDKMIAMRGICRNKFVIPKAESMGVPTLENKGTDAAWTAELDIGAEDTAVAFGKRELRPHDLAKYIKISKKLLRVSALDIESIIRRLMATKMSEPLENGYCNGDGNNEALGVFAASDDGISTGQDVAATNQTSFTGNDLIDFVYALDPRYWGNAKLLVHQTFLQRVRKLASATTDEYLWPTAGTGLETLQSRTILGFPYAVSYYVPHTYTAGLYVAAFGDFDYYWICDGMDLEVEILRELFAATNQLGFIGRISSDGMPVLEEAFVRLAMHS